MDVSAGDKTTDQSRVTEQQGQEDYSFFAQYTAIPLLWEELILACRSLPIGFIQEEEGWSPVAIIGLREKENLFVDSSGNWLAEYRPVYIQACCLAPESGMRQQSMPEDVARQLLTKLDHARKETRQHLELWDRLGLFTPWKITLKGSGSSSMISLDGFYQVREQSIKALDEESLQDLRQNGAWELLCAHWISRSLLYKLVRQVSSMEKSRNSGTVLDLDRGVLSREQEIFEFY